MHSGALLPFSFTDKKALVVDVTKDEKTKSTEKKVKTLDEFVKENNITHMYNHGAFNTAGKIEKLVAKNADCGFVVADGDTLVARTLRAANESSSVNMAWCLEASSGKAMPKGLAVVLTKQVIATPFFQCLP